MKTSLRLFAALLVLSTLFMFAGCAKDEGGTTTEAGTSDTAATTAAPVTTEQPTTAAPTEPPTEHTPLPDLVITSCDTKDGASNVVVDTENKVEGTGSWLHNTKNEVVAIYKFGPLDVSAYATSYLKMSIYCSDIDGLGNNGQIELSSIKEDTGELFWNTSDYVLETGWNEIYLPLDFANTSGDPIDLTAVKHIRIYSLGQTADFNVDDIRMVDWANVPDDKR